MAAGANRDCNRPSCATVATAMLHCGLLISRGGGGGRVAGKASLGLKLEASVLFWAWAEILSKLIAWFLLRKKKQRMSWVRMLKKSVENPAKFRMTRKN